MRLRGYLFLLASVMAWLYFLAPHFTNDTDDPPLFSADASTSHYSQPSGDQIISRRGYTSSWVLYGAVGPRFDMEAFFAYNQSPTPKRFSQVEHYLSVVSSLSKKKKDARSVEEWAKSFKKWQEEADEDEGDMLADDIETCFPTAITTVEAAVQKSKYLKKTLVMSELIKRYMLDLFLNPGMLWVRFAMYLMLSLMIGLLFFGLGDKTSYTSIQSRASVLFYSVSFYIFMVVAVLPFRVHDKAVAAKEVFNSYYHPLAHHVASTLASLIGVFMLAFITTVIMVPMAKFNAPFKFFLDMLLSLNCAEALAQLVTLLVSN